MKLIISRLKFSVQPIIFIGLFLFFPHLAKASVLFDTTTIENTSFVDISTMLFDHSADPTLGSTSTLARVTVILGVDNPCFTTSKDAGVYISIGYYDKATGNYVDRFGEDSDKVPHVSDFSAPGVQRPIVFDMSAAHLDLSKYGISDIELGVSNPNQCAGHLAIGATTVTKPGITVRGAGGGSGQYSLKIEDAIDLVPPRDPVLIIPGVLGSDLKEGNSLLWANDKMALGFDGFMDPLAFSNDLVPNDSGVEVVDTLRKLTVNSGLFKIRVYDYTDSLINQFTSPIVGYTEGKDLFTFPYDWRFGVSSSTVEQLAGEINYILTQTEAGKSAGKVDVIAHSTGALLVKKYVADHPTDHKIRKAVFVGIPNLGSPKALKVLTVGDDFDVPNFDPSEMKKIGLNMPVVYDLAPSPSYYGTAGTVFHISNPLNSLPSEAEKDLTYPQAIQNLIDNNLANQQAVDNSKSLHSSSFENIDLKSLGVDLYSIVGCKSGTFNKFTETTSLSSPPKFDFSKLTTGDGTVPFGSADSLVVDPNKTFFAPKIKHGNLLSADGSRQEIVNLISGSTLSTNGKILTHSEVSNKPDLCEIKGDSINIKSPVAIGVTDQDGNFSGLADDGSIQNDIPGADYEIWGEHKYVFLPTDNGQIYSIKLKGTGSGTFTVDDKSINGDTVTQTQVFSNLPVTTALLGQVNLGATTTLALDNNGDGSVDQTVQPTSVLNTSQSDDVTAPVSTSTLSGTIGKPGFYRGNVSIALTATDPIANGNPAQTSGVFKIVYSLDNAATTTYLNAINVVSEGIHTISFFSTDKAGNNENPKTVTFTIDKTFPELAVSFATSTKDFLFLPLDSADPNPQIVCASSQCTVTDQAGNTALVKFEKLVLPLNIKNLILKTVSYNNGSAITFDPNLFITTYTLSGSVISGLTQTELIKNQQILNILYSQKQNQSTISDLTKSVKAQVSSTTGLKIMQLITSAGKIKTSIK